MRSKLTIASGIEQQEAQNSRLRAQGEFQMDKLRMQEQMRLQGAKVQGDAFMFGQQERRDMQKLNRLSAMAGGYAQQAASYGAQSAAGTGAALGALTGLGYSLADSSGGQGMGKGFNFTPTIKSTPQINIPSYPLTI